MLPVVQNLTWEANRASWDPPDTTETIRGYSYRHRTRPTTADPWGDWSARVTDIGGISSKLYTGTFPDSTDGTPPTIETAPLEIEFEVNAVGTGISGVVSSIQGKHVYCPKWPYIVGGELVVDRPYATGVAGFNLDARAGTTGDAWQRVASYDGVDGTPTLTTPLTATTPSTFLNLLPLSIPNGLYTSRLKTIMADGSTSELCSVGSFNWPNLPCVYFKKIEPTGAHTVDLEWGITSGHHTGIRYKVQYRLEGASGWTGIQNSTATSFTLTDANLNLGADFRVRGRLQNRNGPWCTYAEVKLFQANAGDGIPASPRITSLEAVLNEDTNQLEVSYAPDDIYTGGSSVRLENGRYDLESTSPSYIAPDDDEDGHVAIQQNPYLQQPSSNIGPEVSDMPTPLHFLIIGITSVRNFSDGSATLRDHIIGIPYAYRRFLGTVASGGATEVTATPEAIDVVVEIDPVTATATAGATEITATPDAIDVVVDIEAVTATATTSATEVTATPDAVDVVVEIDPATAVATTGPTEVTATPGAIDVRVQVERVEASTGAVVNATPDSLDVRVNIPATSASRAITTATDAIDVVVEVGAPTASTDVPTEITATPDAISVEVSIAATSVSVGYLAPVNPNPAPINVRVSVFAARASSSSAITPDEELPTLLKQYRYLVTDNTGDVPRQVADWTDVVSNPIITQQINSLTTTVNIALARNEVTRHIDLAFLVDYDGADLTDENDSPFVETSEALLAIGPGTSLDADYDVEIFVHYGSTLVLVDYDGAVLEDSDDATFSDFEGAPGGRRIFKGYVFDYHIDQAQTDKTQVELVSETYEMNNDLFSINGNWEVGAGYLCWEWVLVDLNTQMERILNYTNQRGISLAWDIDKLADYYGRDRKAITKFEVSSIAESIQKIASGYPVDWYYYYDFEHDHFYLKSLFKKPETPDPDVELEIRDPDHYINVDDEVIRGAIGRSMKELGNVVVAYGSEYDVEVDDPDSTDPDDLISVRHGPQWQVVRDTSADRVRRRGLRRIQKSEIGSPILDDSGNVTSDHSTILNLIAKDEVRRFRKPINIGKILVVDSPLSRTEDYKPGQVVKLVNADLAASITSQIVSIRTGPDTAELELGYLRSSVNRRVHALRLDLLNRSQSAADGPDFIPS